MATKKTSKVATTSYLLRQIDSDLWKMVKARAAAEGHGLRWVIMELLSGYAKYGFPGVVRGGKREPGRVRGWKL